MRPAGWGRYDSPGHAARATGDPEAACPEALSPFTRRPGAADPTRADADAPGMSLDQVLKEVADQWRETAIYGLGTAPGQWRPGLHPHAGRVLCHSAPHGGRGRHELPGGRHLGRRRPGLQARRRPVRLRGRGRREGMLSRGRPNVGGC